MTDQLEQRLRSLRPLPMPLTVRARITAAVRAAPRSPSSAPRWISTLAAACLAMAILWMLQPAAVRAQGDWTDDHALSYGSLLNHASNPDQLMDYIDRNYRPIPQFPAFDPEPSRRNRP